MARAIFVNSMFNYTEAQEDPLFFLTNVIFILMDPTLPGGQLQYDTTVVLGVNDTSDTWEIKIRNAVKARASEVLGVAVPNNDIYQCNLRRG